ncbi:unnamed protein product [Pleuronectes platessa]|uniref:Uncharacterized protein n=1 Tax=Pleuronectes platessa TaxID=8262 RepID=A0A9N7YRX4_PLEPL|nr:unnamed protein product [Pleuronectes platessa]
MKYQEREMSAWVPRQQTLRPRGSAPTHSLRETHSEIRARSREASGKLVCYVGDMLVSAAATPPHPERRDVVQGGGAWERQWKKNGGGVLQWQLTSLLTSYLGLSVEADCRINLSLHYKMH